MKKYLLAAAGLLLLAAIYLLTWPVAIDPEAWRPPAPPDLAGTFAANNRLAAVERLGTNLPGPEDVALDAQGQIYTGLEDGRIIVMNNDGSNVREFVRTGGRPLGLRFDKAGNLIVADAYKGLLSISPAAAITVLSTEMGGVPFLLTDDLDIGADGTIYFTDASKKFTVAQTTDDFLEHRPNGRLLAYDPATKTTRLLLDQLYFANGVAISPDQTFLLFAETNKYRIQRYWLTGARAGEVETLIDNLPGFPDGISSNGRDRFWIALATRRNAALDTLLPYPFLRKVVARLPRALSPAPELYGFVLGIDLNGKITHNLQDPTGMSYALVTNVIEHGNKLYLGSLIGPSVGRVAIE